MCLYGIGQIAVVKVTVNKRTEQSYFGVGPHVCFDKSLHTVQQVLSLHFKFWAKCKMSILGALLRPPPPLPPQHSLRYDRKGQKSKKPVIGSTVLYCTLRVDPPSYWIHPMLKNIKVFGKLYSN